MWAQEFVRADIVLGKILAITYSSISPTSQNLFPSTWIMLLDFDLLFKSGWFSISAKGFLFLLESSFSGVQASSSKNEDTFFEG